MEPGSSSSHTMEQKSHDGARAVGARCLSCLQRHLRLEFLTLDPGLHALTFQF